MPITIGLHNFAVQYFLTVPISGDRFMISLSGVAFLELTHGLAGTSDWRRDTATMYVPLKDALDRTGRTPSPGHHLAFVLEQWTPLITPNAFTDLNQAINFGAAVDDFQIDGHGGKPQKSVQVNMNVAVRDIDTTIHRIGYAILVVGSVVEVPNVIIP